MVPGCQPKGGSSKRSNFRAATENARQTTLEFLRLAAQAGRSEHVQRPLTLRSKPRTPIRPHRPQRRTSGSDRSSRITFPFRRHCLPSHEHRPLTADLNPSNRSANQEGFFLALLSVRAPVAQWTEQRPSKPRVAGSNPARRAFLRYVIAGVSIVRSRRARRKSRTSTWIAPATGIAASAPRTPATSAQTSSATMITSGDSATVSLLSTGLSS
jgi:hypothetical protein